jgi:hypothetical protein
VPSRTSTTFWLTAAPCSLLSQTHRNSACGRRFGTARACTLARREQRQQRGWGLGCGAGWGVGCGAFCAYTIASNSEDLRKFWAGRKEELLYKRTSAGLSSSEKLSIGVVPVLLLPLRIPPLPLLIMPHLIILREPQQTASSRDTHPLLSLSSFQIIRTPKKTKTAAEVSKYEWAHKLGNG